MVTLAQAARRRKAATDTEWALAEAEAAVVASGVVRAEAVTTDEALKDLRAIRERIYDLADHGDPEDPLYAEFGAYIDEALAMLDEQIAYLSAGQWPWPHF